MIKAGYIGGTLATGLLLSCCTGCPPHGGASVQPGQTAGSDLAAVETLSPRRTSLRRTTTQPATVHAYHQARVYARVAGYLKELTADIGQQVDAGTVLGTIAVPEMIKSQEKRKATVRRLQADEKRAAAEITVAEAKEKSAAAHLEQARADIVSAEAQLKASRIEYERVRDLVQNQAVAERLSDEALKRYESSQAMKLSAEAAAHSADAGLSVASAKLEAARADRGAARAQTEVAVKELEEIDVLIAYATLRAPFKGVVTERHADLGDLIRNTPTSSARDSPPLFVIAQVDKVRVRVPVPERDASLASVGDPATLTFQALPGRSFPGEVSRIAGSLDEGTRTMIVEIDLENPRHELLPGMFGEATIVLEQRSDSLVLPAGAVRHDETGRDYVYVVDQTRRVRMVDVAVGVDDGHVIEITKGLDGSERVVDAMIGRLKPGQEVRVEDQ